MRSKPPRSGCRHRLRHAGLFRLGRPSQLRIAAQGTQARLPRCLPPRLARRHHGVHRGHRKRTDPPARKRQSPRHRLLDSQPRARRQARRRIAARPSDDSLQRRPPRCRARHLPHVKSAKAQHLAYTATRWGKLLKRPSGYDGPRDDRGRLLPLPALESPRRHRAHRASQSRRAYPKPRRAGQRPLTPKTPGCAASAKKFTAKVRPPKPPPSGPRVGLPSNAFPPTSPVDTLEPRLWTCAGRRCMPTGPRGDALNVTDLDLRKLLTFDPENGRLLLGNERYLLFRQEAFAQLRKLLLAQLGPALFRSILSQFGFAAVTATTKRSAKALPGTARWTGWVPAPSCTPGKASSAPTQPSLSLTASVATFT